MKLKISPSLMCCDYLSLKEQLDIFKKCEIEYLHMDIMDGYFVPNFALGSDYLKSVKKYCSIPQDIHLMVKDPIRYINYLNVDSNDIITVHYESTNDMEKVLDAIKEKGCKAFIVVSPETPVSVTYKYLDRLAGVLVMTVKPGFAGQKLIPECVDKIRELSKYFKEHNIEKEIEVDGNVSFENLKMLKDAGATIFVGGTSSVFYKNDSIENNILHTRKILSE